MKRLIYQVSIGPKTKLYEYCIESVKAYCDQHNIDHILQTKPKLWITPDPFTSNRSNESVARTRCLPIFEKENAFSYLSEYDQVAIVDADIYVKPNCSENFFNDLDSKYAFGAVAESSMPITQEYHNKIVNYTRMQYSNLRDIPQPVDFMNMGFIVMNKSFLDYLDGQTPEQFIRRYEFKRFVDGIGAWKWSTDQTLLNYWIRKRGVPFKNLHWKWNALYTAVRKERLREANFIHFFLKDKLPNRGENINQLMKEINFNRTEE